MRIALTGSSSTGKTTLLEDLLSTSLFKESGISSVKIDIRKIVDSMKVNADGKGCDRNSLRAFQWAVLQEKVRAEEPFELFITDRSTVDMAAYWLVRDSDGTLDEEGKKYLSKCRELASRYDLHIHLPFGAIPFTEDGQRPLSEAFNKNTCKTIKDLLLKWNLTHISLSESGRKERADEVISYLCDHKNKFNL